MRSLWLQFLAAESLIVFNAHIADRREFLAGCISPPILADVYDPPIANTSALKY